jgi:hypothetical protein
VERDIDEAESALRQHKAERERTGCIARGELRSIIVGFVKGKDLSTQLQTSPAVVLPAIHTSTTEQTASLVLLP